MVVEPVLAGLVERAREILTGPASTSERLAAAMISHARSFEDNYPQMFVMTRENGETLSDKRREEIDVLRREYFSLWRQAVIEGQERGEIRDDIDAIALSALTWSVWEGALLRMKVEGSVKPLRESMGLVLDHLYPPVSQPRARTSKVRRRSL